MQITERKSELAKLETLDCGKPLDEAAWDIVTFPGSFVITIRSILQHSSYMLIFPKFSRMMLLGVLSIMLVLVKAWMQSKGRRCLFQWKPSTPMCWRNQLVLLDLLHLGTHDFWTNNTVSVTIVEDESLTSLLFPEGTIHCWWLHGRLPQL